jgi:hypothetical protein
VIAEPQPHQFVSPCTVDLEVGQKRVLIRTAEGRFLFEVWEGGIDREVWDLLKALEAPYLRDNVLRQWTVSTPRPFTMVHVNEGPDRRFVVFQAPGRARLVLRCVEGAHPNPITHDLHHLFKRLERKEPHEENRSGQPAHPQGRAVEGRGPGDGEGPGPGLDGPARQAETVEELEARKLAGRIAYNQARARNELTPNQKAYLEKIRAAKTKSSREHGGIGRRRNRGSRKKF